MSNKNFSCRQFLSLGLGLMSSTALVGLAGCSEGPSTDAAATTTAATGAADSATGVDKDAFNNLVASVEQASDGGRHRQLRRAGRWCGHPGRPRRRPEAVG